MNRLYKFLFVAWLVVVTSSVWAEAPAAPKWTTSVNLGLNMTRGNSKTTASSGSIVSERKGDQNEVSLGLEGNYGQTEETQSDGAKQMKTTVQNEKGYAKYRRLFTDRDYAYFNGELSQDKIADIKYRLIIGPGLGRYFIKSDKKHAGGEAVYLGSRIRLAMSRAIGSACVSPSSMNRSSVIRQRSGRMWSTFRAGRFQQLPCERRNRRRGGHERELQPANRGPRPLPQQACAPA